MNDNFFFKPAPDGVNITNRKGLKINNSGKEEK